MVEDYIIYMDNENTTALIKSDKSPEDLELLQKTSLVRSVLQEWVENSSEPLDVIIDKYNITKYLFFSILLSNDTLKQMYSNIRSINNEILLSQVYSISDNTLYDKYIDSDNNIKLDTVRIHRDKLRVDTRIRMAQLALNRENKQSISDDDKARLRELAWNQAQKIDVPYRADD